MATSSAWQKSLRQNVPGVLHGGMSKKVHQGKSMMEKVRRLSVVEDDKQKQPQKRLKRASVDLDTRDYAVAAKVARESAHEPAKASKAIVAKTKPSKKITKSTSNLKISVVIPVPTPLDLKVVKNPIGPILSPIPLPKGVICIDEVESNSLVDCWPDFVAYLQQKESAWVFPPDILIGKSSSLVGNRFILMNWILEVIYHIHACQETLYICVGLIDAVFALREVDSVHYQLVAITSLLIASKLEEYHPPDIKQLIALTENSYTFDEVIQMEMKILDLLQFEVSLPSPMIFLNRYIRASLSHDNPFFKEACLFFYDCLIPCVEYSSYPNSKKAAAAIYATRQVFEVSEDKHYLRWTPTLEYYTKYAESDVFELALRMIDILLKLHRGKQAKKPEEGVMKKFKSRTRHKAMILRPELSLERIETVVEILNVITSNEL
ncbi:hypothetical protein TCAL_05091 [Tigriopus californicus]|uniref:Cyclin N-terminal domain-containing protein n=1 Tax=Tigriopus californicus TaxID=6832 RepID=A0A553NS61_TIGCA|nr:G2/mitotic-specific cyclin-B2-like [Tigriopus californicus]TRY68239.1 hypothetical protein TCAL_05091 [Tigriopus californicus]|eukprot:TCALIF_05091-PA protein Name:"Similar to CYCB2-4 Cyclin-B2-4 (Arabidopsis thaliana)" AED:0.34 eAED:0.34 QI:0/-1/0/1/-1/1/1/0/434